MNKSFETFQTKNWFNKWVLRYMGSIQDNQKSQEESDVSFGDASSFLIKEKFPSMLVETEEK